MGGVDDFSSLLRDATEVHAHDFVGCLHSLTANDRHLLDLDAAINYTRLSDTCPRQQAAGLCGDSTCSGHGQCRDRWSHVECLCEEGYSGQRCEMGEWGVSLEGEGQWACGCIQEQLGVVDA